MKIMVKVLFNGKCFKAKGDDDLENLSRFEAISDMIGSINNMIENIYDSLEGLDDAPPIEYFNQSIRWELKAIYGNSDNSVVLLSEIPNINLIWAAKVKLATIAAIDSFYTTESMSLKDIYKESLPLSDGNDDYAIYQECFNIVFLDKFRSTISLYSVEYTKKHSKRIANHSILNNKINKNNN